MRKADDQIIRDLRRWGAVQVMRHSGGATAAHPLEDAANQAPGTATEAMSQHAARAGTSRRRLMAAAAGVKGMTMLPEWAVDPVKARNDADPPRSFAADVETPADLQWIDRAVTEIARQNRLRAQVLAAEFGEVGTQERKARIVAKAYGGRLSVHQYRRELRLALDWVRMRAGHASAA